jgi:hypothetical protein
MAVGHAWITRVVVTVVLAFLLLPPVGAVYTLTDTAMDGPLKELAKLEKLTAKSSTKGKAPSITDSLDSLLEYLKEAKAVVENGTSNEETFIHLAHTVDARKKEVDDRQKEVYGSLSRFGKALDKVRAWSYLME